MDTQIDLSSLTHEQLVFLVQVRGQALAMHSQADHVLFDKIETKTFQEGDLERYMTAKNDILHGLMTAEEQIIAGHKKPLAN